MLEICRNGIVRIHKRYIHDRWTSATFSAAVRGGEWQQVVLVAGQGLVTARQMGTTYSCKMAQYITLEKLKSFVSSIITASNHKLVTCQLPGQPCPATSSYPKPHLNIFFFCFSKKKGAKVGGIRLTCGKI